MNIELINRQPVDKQKRILIVAVILSLIIHVAVFYLMDFRHMLALDSIELEESIPQEVEFVFPENKPREIVQNMNENQEVPERSDLLSDKNSRARNPVQSDKSGESPLSSGNTPFSNLSNPDIQKSFKPIPQKKFSTAALTGESSQEAKDVMEDQQKQSEQTQMQSTGSNQMLDQKDFSVEELGALTLSTYQWRWAPYINAMKNKLSRVWYPPSAYYMLGIIHGYTIIQYTISRDGRLLKWKVLRHEGHESLQVSSEEAIKAIFPFIPLPDDFPDQDLTITAKLYYPDLRGGR